MLALSLPLSCMPSSKYKSTCVIRQISALPPLAACRRQQHEPPCGESRPVLSGFLFEYRRFAWKFNNTEQNICPTIYALVNKIARENAHHFRKTSVNRQCRI